MMYANIFMALIILSALNLSALGAVEHISIAKADSCEKMGIIIALLNRDDTKVEDLCNKIGVLLKNILHRGSCTLSGFRVELEQWREAPSQKKLVSVSKKGFPLIIFLQCMADQSLQWRLYDAESATMLQGKQIKLSDHNEQRYAELIADSLWPLLTGQEGFFSTRIAFCTQMKHDKHAQKSIFIAVPYGNTAENNYPKPKKLIENIGAFGLRWNNDPYNPLVLFSQTTHRNVRLMSVNLYGLVKVISNLDGINMLPCFSADGSKVIYCASSQGKTHLFLYENSLEHGPCLRRMTHNSGNNVSPTLCENGDIIFCSDFQKKCPQIYYYYAVTKELEPITKDGYCASPHFCEKNKKIVYTKLHKGFMQLFIYDCLSKKHLQITNDAGNKQECSWSPCGNYLVFSLVQGQSSRIVVMNIVTGERSFLTKAGERCSNPAWSGRLNVFC